MLPLQKQTEKVCGKSFEVLNERNVYVHVYFLYLNQVFALLLCLFCTRNLGFHL